MATLVYDHEIFSIQQLGGVSRYICELAARVLQRGRYSIKVVAPFHINELLAQSSIPHVGIYIPTRRSWSTKAYTFANNLTSRPLISLMDPDFVHQTYYRTAPLMSRLPMVVTVHDMIHELLPHYFPSDDPTRRRKRASVAAADHVFCVSQSTANDLINILGVARSKITVTHLGCSAVFTETAPPRQRDFDANNRPYILYVGERNFYKNFRRFAEAFASNARIAQNIDLCVFGGGPLTAAELMMFKDMGLRENAVRWRAGNDALLSNYYKNALAFVFPSEYEGFGIPLLESMNCRCPVLCGGGGAISEVMGPAAEYFDASSVESIGAAIENVVFDDARRQELIAAGSSQARHFSWDKCAGLTMKVYDKFS